jgi:hypothetical protein
MIQNNSNDNKYKPKIHSHFSNLINWNQEGINTLNSIEEEIKSCPEVDKIGFDEHISTLKEMHFLIDRLIGDTYFQSQLSYASGRTHAILVSKKLQKSRGNIIAGMNRSNPIICDSFSTFIEKDRNFDSYISYMKGITTSWLSFHDNYLNRWQMYDKLFHDRVRGK